MNAKISIAIVSLALGACGTIKDRVAYNDAAPAITTVRVDLLRCQCADDTLLVAVRNAMIAEIFRRADAKVVTDGAADVALDGTITHSEGSVSRSKANGFSAGAGSTSGRYASGITLMARRGDTLIATGSYALPAKAGEILPAEAMATRATQSIMRELFANGLKPKQ